MSRGGKRMVMWSLDSSSQRTCTPDSFALVVQSTPTPTTGEPAPAQRDRAYTAEPGVPPMTDNPSYRGRPGSGAARDDYYDDRYGRPEDREGGQDPRAQYPPDQRGYPPQGEPGYGQRPGYPEQPAGGYPDAGRRLPRAAGRRLPRAAGRRLPRARAATRRRSSTSSARPPATGRRRVAATPSSRAAATPSSRAATASHPPVTRRLQASRDTAVTTAVRPPRRARKTTAVRPGRLPGPARRLSRPGRRLRRAGLRRPAVRPPGVRRSPTTAATASRRPAAHTPTRVTASPHAGGYDYGQPAGAPGGGYGGGYGAARLPGRRRHTSPCSSTTAAAGPTSCARAPT